MEMFIIVLKFLASVAAGWICGVIINYISDTLPEQRRFTAPTCKACYREIPIINYIMGKPCKTCRKPMKTRFWMINIIATLLVVCLVLSSTENFAILVFDIVIYLFLMLITIIDIEHHLVLIETSIAGMIILGARGIIAHGLLITCLGGIAGFGILFVFYLLGRAYAGYLARKKGLKIDEGMGFGDVSLSGICGLVLGWPGIIAGVFLGVILGGVWSLGMLVRARIVKDENPMYQFIAYAPFLTTATAVLWALK